MELKRKMLNLAKKILVSLAVLTVFAVLMMSPGLGYKGQADVKVLWGDVIGYLWVETNCNITYFPFTFPLTWLVGQGRYSDSFIFISKPTYYYANLNERTKDMSLRILHRSPEDLEKEAVQRAVIKQLWFNLPFLFVLVLLIGFVRLHDLYVSILTSISCFSTLGTTAAIIVFIVASAFFLYLKRLINEGVLLKTWNFMVEEYEKRWKMGEERIEKLDVKKLPFFYKILLKIPLPSLEPFAEEMHGIFWAIIVPIFLVSFVLSGFLTLVYFPFPTNIVIFLIVPTAILLLFLRLMLERFINEWNAMVREPREWNVEKSMDEYFKLIDKHKEED